MRNIHINLNALFLYSTELHYFEDKKDCNTGDSKGLRWPSVSFTPHLALSVMKNDKRADKDRSISYIGPTRLNKCYTIQF